MSATPENTALILIDVQERLASAMHEFEPCANRIELLLVDRRESTFLSQFVGDDARYAQS